MPTANHGGAQAYVRGTLRSVSPCPAIPIPASKSTTAVTLLVKPDTTQTPPPAYSTIYPPTPPSSAPSSPDSIQPIARPPSTRSNSDSNKPTNVVTAASPVKPQLTPRSSTDAAPLMAKLKRNKVLTAVFPSSSPIHQLPIAAVDLADISPNWVGSVVDNPAMGTRSLYVCGGSYCDVNLRESVCDVFEKAESELGCTGVVICLEKNSPDLGELVHQLLYLGGTITSSPFAPNPAYLLVGLDL